MARRPVLKWKEMDASVSRRAERIVSLEEQRALARWFANSSRLIQLKQRIETTKSHLESADDRARVFGEALMALDEIPVRSIEDIQFLSDKGYAGIISLVDCPERVLSGLVEVCQHLKL